MPLVVTLEDFRPPPRYPPNNQTWTLANIREAAAGTGPWTLIETLALVADPDPSLPALRDLTTTQATLESGWYQVQWQDAAGNTALSGAVWTMGGTLPISPSDARRESPLLAQLYPDTPYSSDVETDLERLLATATDLVEELTCRILDGTLPQEDVLLARRAVVLKAEGLATGGTLKARQTALTRAASGGLRSISAGPWSESYFGPEEATKAKMLSPDSALHEVLWALATEECQQKWLALWGARPAPASGWDAFDYSGDPLGPGTY